MLRAGRGMRTEVAELFLLILRRVCVVLGLPVYVGSRGFGGRVGGCIPFDQARSMIHNREQLDFEEQRRLQGAHLFFVPDGCDPEGSGVRWGWVFVRAVSA